MKVTIVNKFTADGKEYFEWRLLDGPDGIEEVRGFASDLIVAFSKIIEWRERIAADYAKEVLEDLDTLKNFLSNNETDN
jgi:hypothetical protein